MEITEERLIKILDTRFDAVDKRLDKHEGIFVTMLERFDHVDEEIGEIKHRVTRIESTLGDVQEELHTLSSAFDADSETLINHKQRISVLETKFA